MTCADALHRRWSSADTPCMGAYTPLLWSTGTVRRYLCTSVLQLKEFLHCICLRDVQKYTGYSSLESVRVWLKV